MDDYAALRARLLKRMPHWNVVDAENMREAHDAISAQAAELAALRAALARLWPLLDKATKDYVFTAERAGEVIADMETLRRAGLAAAQEQKP